MARSKYVYVVTRYDGHTDTPIIAAFTVKHELVTWMRYAGDDDLDCIFRVPDNRSANVVQLVWGELLNATNCYTCEEPNHD